MFRKSKTFSPLLFTLIVAINHDHHVQGAGYQGNNHHSSSKDADNSDNSGSANYNFEYAVEDGGVGPQFGHQEERNGYETRGRYSVLLPDGRLQVVTYKADKNGYVADITYENGPTKSTQTKGGGYNMKQQNNGGGYNYEASATSYGPPPPPPPSTTQHNDNNNSKGGGYSGKDFGSGNGNTNSVFGRRNSRSFVKLRRTVDGKMFNYMY